MLTDEMKTRLRARATVPEVDGLEADSRGGYTNGKTIVCPQYSPGNKKASEHNPAAAQEEKKDIARKDVPKEQGSRDMVMAVYKTPIGDIKTSYLYVYEGENCLCLGEAPGSYVPAVINKENKLTLEISVNGNVYNVFYTGMTFTDSAGVRNHILVMTRRNG